MPVGDWRGETTEGPAAPPAPQWNPAVGAQTEPIPEAPPMMGGDWEAQRVQTEGVPKAPPMMDGNWDGQKVQKDGVPDAPPVPSWDSSARAQVAPQPSLAQQAAQLGAQRAAQRAAAQPQPIVPPAEQPPQ